MGAFVKVPSRRFVVLLECQEFHYPTLKIQPLAERLHDPTGPVAHRQLANVFA